MPATDVDELFDSSEVVCVDNGCAHRCAETGHRVVENAGRLRILGEVLEVGLAVNFLERGLAGLSAVAQLAPNPPVPIGAKKDREATQAVGGIAAQRLTDWREAKISAVILREDTDTC